METHITQLTPNQPPYPTPTWKPGQPDRVQVFRSGLSLGNEYTQIELFHVRIIGL